MRSGSNGLQRDLNVVRHRAWLFLPFAILGIVVAFAFGSVAGDANAAATMQIETVVHDVFSGGDRGMRVFEAQAMTQDKAFKDRVLKATGLPSDQYARYAISLSPISVADGVSRGVLTVSIKDPKKAEAERLRNEFVNVFYDEYTKKDGLFRQRFIQTQLDVANGGSANYSAALDKLKPIAEKHGVPLDELVRSTNTVRTSMSDELTEQETRLFVEQAQLKAALASTPTGALATALLGRPVSDPEAGPALRARQSAVDVALDAVRQKKFQLSDAAYSPEERAVIDEARGAVSQRQSGYTLLNNARAAVDSAESHIETSYSFSGGVAGTPVGRLAVAVAITLVFGLIAIYLFEWLAQVRTGAQGRTA